MRVSRAVKMELKVAETFLARARELTDGFGSQMIVKRHPCEVGNGVGGLSQEFAASRQIEHAE